MPGQGAVTTTGDSATGASGVRDGRDRIERYDPASHRAALAGALGRARPAPDRPVRRLEAPLLPADDVRLPVGLAAHRALVREDADRRDRPLPADARRQRLPADRASMRFGLPAENAAIKNRMQPARVDDGEHRHDAAPAADDGRRAGTGTPRSSPATPSTTAGTSGCSCSSSRPGLAYRAVSAVDWCPNDGTLAREQVEGADRHCWRCGAKVEKRELPQWYLRITDYADELLDFGGHRLARPDPDHADELDRPVDGRRDRVRDRAVAASRGRRGAARVHDPARHAVRGDVHGAGAGAPAGRDADGAGAAGRGRGVRRWQPRRRPRSTGCRPTARRPASPIGADAINPVNGERIPIFVADYVLGGYGTGAIMAVPAHDERDFEFAKQFGLPIVKVVMPKGADPDEVLESAFVEHTVDEVMVNSGRFTGRPAADRLARDRRLAGGAGQGPDRRHLPAARLAGQPPALLGHADPGHPLRAVRHGPGPRGPAAGAAAGRRSTTTAAARTR